MLAEKINTRSVVIEDSRQVGSRPRAVGVGPIPDRYAEGFRSRDATDPF